MNLNIFHLQREMIDRTNRIVDIMNLDRKSSLVMGIFVTAVFVLTLMFLRPVTINVVFEGDGPVATVIPGVYTLLDGAILAIAAFLLGVSGVILFQTYERSPVNEAGTYETGSLPELHYGDHNHDPELSPEHAFAAEPDNLLNLLKGSERVVMEALMNYGEMNQAALSARTGIPKSTLSRTLQNLEDRKIIFRYDNGMSKMVRPEIHWKENNGNH